ncbi:polymer-forming cytoskeletal protein [Erwinia sp. PK3-005]|uniref:Polymer-forming cytoskeletal protein n=1 Tax=Mixta hanseatica TaxID=2872648 RepID=A0ABY4R9P3_9GAMM|nr:polymer-forming cytoskeletal protein [Mixta hanseatica]UQY43531.1 polymer-forming cytoskeletal protein [Mixta hanseatica]
MFKRKEKMPVNNYTAEPQESVTPPQPAQNFSETVSAAIVVDKEATIIPSSCYINGEIKASGDMKINGSIDGTITAEKTVYILSKGSVDGEIYAAKVVVDGKVTGVCASAVVEINASGFIDGTIESDDLSINKNGRFYGISKPLAIKTSPSEKPPVSHKENSDEKLTIIQQVLDNVPDK